MELITIDLEFGTAEERNNLNINFIVKGVMCTGLIDYEDIIRKGLISNIIITNVPKEIEYEVSKFIFNSLEVQEKIIQNEKILGEKLYDYL